MPTVTANFNEARLTKTCVHTLRMQSLVHLARIIHGTEEVLLKNFFLKIIPASYF